MPKPKTAKRRKRSLLSRRIGKYGAIIAAWADVGINCVVFSVLVRDVRDGSYRIAGTHKEEWGKDADLCALMPFLLEASAAARLGAERLRTSRYERRLVE